MSEATHEPVTCWPLVRGLSTVLQKFIQLLLETRLGARFEWLGLVSDLGRDQWN